MTGDDCCKQNHRLPVFLAGMLLVVWLGGCASDGEQWNIDDYTVKSGDTIYSIAWRYEIDPADLARWNGIDTRTYRIRPGQRLHTRPPVITEKPAVEPARREERPVVAPPKNTLSRTPASIVVKKGDTLYAISRRHDVSIKALIENNHLKKPYSIYPGQTLSLRSPATGKTTAGTAGSGVAPKKPAGGWAKRVNWQWPVTGKVVSHFRRNRHDARGIDIAGKAGQPVHAAASGKVVYSGNGLISYGNLIIVKHNKSYLSAYAYNRRLLVREGQWVEAGQRIAEMGSKEGKGPRLHFEIRRNGKPVDPERYLP